MKKILVFATIATLSANVHAATSSAKKSKSAQTLAAASTAAAVTEAEDNSTAPSTTAAANVPAAATNTNATQAASNQSSLSLDAEAKATEGKNWSMTVLNQTSMDAATANYSNNTNKNFATLNYVGGDYKLDKKNRVGLRQYFAVDHDATAAANSANKFTNMDTTLTWTRSMDGALKSDPVTAVFWYYAPTSDASQAVRSNGSLRADAEFAWTLTPKWTVSYYFNPRQSMLPDGTQIDPASGKSVPAFSKTTLIHYASLYYVVSDSVYAYTYAGYKHRWQTSNMTLNEESVLTALGTSFSFFGGKLNLNPEVSAESHTVNNFQKVAAESVLQEQNISYMLQTAVIF